MRFDRKYVILLTVLLSLLAMSACEYSLAQDVAPPPGSELSIETPTPEAITFPSGSIDLSRGEAIYSTSCAPCHGFTGLGDGEQAGELPFAVPPIADPELARQRSPLEWYAMISQGNLERFMPPFAGSLSPDERWDVLAYLYRLAEEEQTELAAADLFVENCADCHGETGVGDGLLAAQQTSPLPDFSSIEVTARTTRVDYFSTLSENSEDDIHSFDAFSQDQVWALAALVQSLALGGEGFAAVQPDQASPSAPVVASEGLNSVGQVSNGSGGNLPEGLEISLHAFDQLEEKFTQISHLGADGIFEFEPVRLEEELIYLASIEYADLTYFSEILTAEDIEDDGKLHFSIVVYDSSRDISNLRVERVNFVIEFPSAERVQLVQQVQISNDGELAAAPGEAGEPLLEYYLPPEAGNVTFEQGAFGDRYVISEAGFGDLRAVLPGQNSYQMLYAFDLPYKRALEYEQVISLPTQDLLVFLPTGNVRLESENFVSLGEQLIEGVSYQAYRFAGELQVGDQITIALSGPHPLAGGSFGSLIYDRDFQIGFLVLVSALAFSWLWLRGRLPTHKFVESPNAIMDAIIDLDESLEKGELTKRIHAKKREQLKKELGRAMEDRKKND
jgi:mono/diheme cytochrome c family protein